MTAPATKSEAARAVREIVDAICAGVRWPACFDVALAAIQREDAERAATPAEPAAPATDAEPVAWRTPHPEQQGIYRFHQWIPLSGTPNVEPLYTAAQLAAAEARGRASAEERIAALREALEEIASHPASLTCDEDPYYMKAVARAALAADDAAEEAGK